MDRVLLTGLTCDAFQADTDRKALEALRRLPLVPAAVQKFYEIGADRWLYCWNMAVSVRMGPDQYPTLYRILQECCEVLDVPEPEIYLTNHPFANAFAGGVERPYITLRSSIVDTLNDDELYHLIGHELGHIKCGHILYFSVARVLMPLLEMLGRRTLGLGDAAQIAAMAAFMDWSRNAELSADRAGLLCAQNFATSLSANLHLCGGPHRLQDEGNPAAFLEQAQTYQDMNAMDSFGKLMIAFFYSTWSTHPMPVHRTQALERWHAAGEMDRILEWGRQRNAAPVVN